MGNKAIIEHICRHFRMPNSFEKFVYISQVLQALSIKSASEHWRRCKPTCMGVVYWQLNDIWQGPSWSSLEYDGRWKVLQYFARNFFAPLLVSSLETAEREVEIWVTSDIGSALSLVLTVQLWNWKGRLIEQWSESFQAEPHCSKALWKRKTRDILKAESVYEEEKKRASCFLLYSLSTKEGEAQQQRKAQNVHNFAPFKCVTLHPARLTLELAKPKDKNKPAGGKTERIKDSEGKERRKELKKHRGVQKEVIHLKVTNESSEAVAPFVVLQSAQVKGHFNDNGFLLLPQQSRE